jgi:hypothetical protein
MLAVTLPKRSLVRSARCFLSRSTAWRGWAVITVLNVHKPRGLTPYGQHKHAKEPKGSTRNRAAVPR